MHDLKDILESKFDEEIKGALEYDEIIEKVPKDKDKTRKELKEIMADQLGHALKIRIVMADLGYPEPKNWQKLEDILKIEEERHPEHSEYSY